jgi:branched-chain amino acid transport system ATP-binding protein
VSGAALAHVVVSGLATGCIYALMALSLVIVYNATRTLNFAQGEMLMFSTFVAWTAQRANTEVFRALSALDNVLVGAHPRLRGGALAAACWLPGVRREETMARVAARALLERVGLGEVAGVDAGELPLGSQKRLEMARALAGGPRLLLLDEPAGGLNPTETRTLMDLIRRLRDELGLAIMVVEHDMDLVMAISDRVAVLHHGLVIATGSPREVAANPAVIDAYLGPPASAPL